MSDASNAANIAEDWERIVSLYDALLTVAPSPVVQLNRAVALAEVHGATAGREALRLLEDDKRLIAYPFYWAALADLARRSGELESAARNYECAANVSRSRAERIAYRRRAEALRSEDDPASAAPATTS